MNADLGRQARQLIKGVGAQLAGRERGPDHDPEGKLRTPRRNSFDADDDPRARPWSQIGDGTPGQGIAYLEALIEAADELRHEHWKLYPLAEVADARARHDALEAELKAYLDGAEAAVGRPATIRLELVKLAEYLRLALARLRDIDVKVLKALTKNIDFATGRLFPAIATIAARAGCHRNSVVAALRRLRAHGFIEWVRRSVKTGNVGEFAPQREQTSNAYYFEHRRRMHDHVWQRYWQRVVAKLRRLGARRPPDQSTSPREVTDPALKGVLARVGALIDAAEAATNAST